VTVNTNSNRNTDTGPGPNPNTNPNNPNIRTHHCTKGIETMKLSTTHRIATLGIAAAAVTAIGGTVSVAGDDATTCQTWHPRIMVSDAYQHTWNPADVTEGGYQHTWNPADVTEGGYQHTWNPADVTEGGYQHTWNPAGDRSDACVSPTPTTP
jgi:hypothetical protein